MIWAAFSWDGKLELQFTTKKMDSKEYTQILEESLLPFYRRIRGKKPTYQQDNARMHVSRETKAWFAAKKIATLDWPACSPDMNPMENLWAIISRRVYANAHQYNNERELKNAIQAAYDSVDKKSIETLILSMPKRISELLQKRGGMTSY